MTVEYRVTNSGYGTFAAEIRFDGADEALWRDGIRPGWHAFKRSKTRAVCERAIALDRANRAAEAEAVLEMHEFRQIAGDR